MGRRKAGKAGSDAEQRPSQRWRGVEWAVLGGALLLRFFGLLSLEQTGYADHLLVDAQTYWSQALGLMRGADPFREGFYQPPGYPVFLVAVSKFAGVESGYLPVRLAQLMMGMVTTWAIVRLGRRIGARLNARWIGAVAGGLYVLYPSTLLFEQDLLTPAITQVSLVLAILLLWRDGGPGSGRLFFAGLFLGVAAVIHTTMLTALLALALGLWVWKSELRRRLVYLVLGAAIALAPTTSINLSRWGQPTLVSDNAGLNFYLGNNADWKDTAFLQAGLPFRMLILEASPEERPLTHQRNSYWKSRAWQEIAEAPGTWLFTLGTKAIWSVNNREIPRNEDYRCRTQDGPMQWMGWLPVRYGWVFPLALAGGVLLWRQRRAERIVPLVWLGLHGSMVFFLVSDRYRLAAWPMVCLCASVGVYWLWDRVKAWKEGWRPPGPAWGLSVLVILPWLPIDDVTAFEPGWCARVSGNFARADGDKSLAIEHYREALDAVPGDMSARFHLSETLLLEGQPSQAAAILEPLLEVFPGSFPAQRLMAKIQKRMGQWEAVAVHAGLAHAIPHRGTSTDALYVEALVKLGRMDEARAVVDSVPKLGNQAGVKALLGD
ncbi:MAG: tetratricopeptide repeat protein [Myxococcota bacterium]|nr:tetratricopeptide repeat protein [Myxococcota bacterium]